MVDFNFYGHQIVTSPARKRGSADAVTNQVDGHGVPAPHFRRGANG
jgi:extradiol dioxygenase family protein